MSVIAGTNTEPDILYDKAPSSPMLRWDAVFLISATVSILPMIF